MLSFYIFGPFLRNVLHSANISPLPRILPKMTKKEAFFPLCGVLEIEANGPYFLDDPVKALYFLGFFLDL